MSTHLGAFAPSYDLEWRYLRPSSRSFTSVLMSPKKGTGGQQGQLPGSFTGACGVLWRLSYATPLYPLGMANTTPLVNINIFKNEDHKRCNVALALRNSICPKSRGSVSQ